MSDPICAIKKWVAENPERAREFGRMFSKKRRQSVRGKIEANIRSAMHRGATRGYKKQAKTFELLGYSPADLIAHLEREFMKGMSWDNYGRDGWHIDHIVPLSSFSYETTCDPDFRSAWALSNLRPLWQPDNICKGAKREFLL